MNCITLLISRVAHRVAIFLAVLLDAGSVFDRIGDTSLKHWKPSGGVGFLLSWNVSTVVSFDLGKSGEGNLFYMGLGFPY